MSEHESKPDLGTLVVSGVGAVRAQQGAEDGLAFIEVWNENSDDPGDEPYLTFGPPLDPEAEGPYRQTYLPRAAWTVTSGEGVVVLAATALGPKREGG